MNKILILAPDLKALGGVARHYAGLKDFLSEQLYVKFLTTGTRRNISGKYFFLSDYVKLIFAIIISNPRYFLINPSLQNKAIRRDSIFLKAIYRLKRKKSKVIVFFHGWDLNYEKKIEANLTLLTSYYKADKVIVLNSYFRDKLRGWGFQNPIHISSTKIEENLLDYFDYNKRVFDSKKILFLSRLEKNKGVYIAVETFNILRTKFNDLELHIVGNGSEYTNLQRLIKQQKQQNIYLHGGLKGKELADAYINSDVYLFPSFHGEGMPTTVLEAMAFGLPIISYNNIGISDILEDNKTGFIINTLFPEDYANKILELFSNPNLRKKCSNFNFIKAKRFYASNVAKDLVNIIVKENESDYC